MKRLFTRLLISMFFMTPSLVDAQTVVLTPSNLPNWSGTVTSAGVVSSSAIANIENGANKGFVRFDLSSLPTGAVISSASLRLKTVNGLGATSGNAEITTTVSTVNTLTATSAAIAAAINSSTASNAGVTSWVSISSSVTLNLSFSNYSKTQLQDAIAGGFVTIGIVNNSNLIHNFYDSSTGSADIPQLTITYNVPIAPPNCSPSPLLPLVGDTMIIRNNTRLVWNAAFGYPSSYDVYFDANPSPTTLVYSNQSFSQYIHSTVLASKTTYYWKVVPRNFKGPATGCAVWNFTTGSSLLYCVTSPLIGGSGDIITNVTMGTLNNTSTYSTVSPSYFTSYNNSPPPNLTQGISQNISITFGANGTQHSAVWIDFNQNGTYEPSENVALSTVALGANATITYSLNIPPTAKLGLTKMRVRGGSNTAYTAEGACTQSSYGETEDYDVNITPGVTCTGVPSAGTTTSTSTTACNNVNFSLGLSGASMTTGLTYQWESSPTGAGTFSSVSGATSPIFLATQSAATDYRCVITCIVSGSSATSVPVTVNMSNLFNCYCTNTALSNGNEEITKVTFNNVSNTSTCASLTGTIGTATGTANLYANYTNYNLTNILQGSTIPYSVEITQCTGSSFGHAANIYIDFNRNGALTDAGEVFSIWTYASSGTHTVSGNIVVPIGASVGATLMRVEVKENNSLGSCASGQVTKGETEDYKINILPNTACNGMPISGVTISSSTNACSGVNFNLSLSGASLEIGLTYQWESSPSGTGMFSSISGATSSSFSTTQTVATDYRCVITCTASVSSATSVPVTVNMANLFNCYCTNAALSNGDEEITKVTFNGVTNTSTCASLAGTIGTATGSANLYANYTAYNLTNVQQGSTIPYSVELTECSSVAYLHAANIYIDFNRNGLLTDAGEKFVIWAFASSGTHTVTGNIAVPIGASIGTTLMRIEVKSDNTVGACAVNSYGETEDYKITINPTQCASPISAGTSQLASGLNTLATKCDDASSFTFYGTGGIYSLGVKWGTNTAAKAAATASITKYNAPPSIVSATNAVYMMPNVWNIDAPVQPTIPVLVRYYYTATDSIAAFNAAQTFATTVGGTVTPTVWFKSITGVFNPTNAQYNSGNGSIVASSVVQLTPTYGSHTISGGGTAKYVEFMISSFSGGTSAVGGGGLSSPLPVVFKGFKGSVTGNINTFVWEAGVQLNTAVYRLERSINGRDWTTIATVVSNSTLKYSSTDTNPVCNAYYRVIGVDNDGKIWNTQVINLTRRCNKFNITTAYPVPTEVKATIQYESVGEANVSLVLIDIVGRIIIVQNDLYAKDGFNTVEVDLSTQSSGTYFVTLNNGTDQITQRLIKN